MDSVTTKMCCYLDAEFRQYVEKGIWIKEESRKKKIYQKSIVES